MALRKKKGWLMLLLLVSVSCATRLFVIEGDRAVIGKGTRIAVLAIEDGEKMGEYENEPLRSIIQSALIKKGYTVIHTSIGRLLTRQDADLLFPEGFYSFKGGVSKGLGKGGTLSSNDKTVGKLTSATEVDVAIRRMLAWRLLEKRFYQDLKVRFILVVKMLSAYSYEVYLIDVETKELRLVFAVYSDARGWEDYFGDVYPEKTLGVKVGSVTPFEYTWAQLAEVIVELIEK